MKRLTILFVFATVFFVPLMAQNNALVFDGTDDYVDCGTINLSGSAITLEGWVKVDAFQSSSPYISQIFGSESGENSAFLRLGDEAIPTGNKIEFLLFIGSTQVSLTSSSTLATNQWYHLAGTYDGSNMKIYINGVEDASNAQTGNFTSNTSFFLGTGDGTTRYLDGTLDEVRVWNDARTQTEIQTYMNIELKGDESGLVAYYQMSDGSGTSLTDNSSNSNTGTLVGGTAWGSSTALQGDLPAGDGSSGNPYQIGTLANLYWISQHSASWDKYFSQTADIDASITSGWENSAGFLPIAFDSDNDGTPRFTGNYDGKGFSISNFHISRSSSSNVGLFSHLGASGDGDGEKIVDVHLINVDVTGGRGTGSLCGRVTGDNTTFIEKCSAESGTVVGDGATGGLVGSNNSYVENPGNRDHHPTIIKCFADIDVSWSGSGGADKLGGLSGCNQKGKILNSYALGDVLTGTSSSTERVGGLAGCILIRGYIENSYSAGAVTGGSNVGGFVGNGGTGGGDGETILCFWDTQTSGQSSSAPTSGCTGKTTFEMKTQSTFTGWDFTNTWEMIGFNYPRLKENVDTSLPVELTGCSLEQCNKGVLIKWTTESETENRGFILARKNKEDQTWTEFADFNNASALKGQGSTTERHDYQFIDKAIQPGTTYEYRLGDVDFSGRVTWHSPIEIIIPLNEAPIPTEFGLQKVYPNPFNPVTNIRYHLPEDCDVAVTVYDLKGNLIKKLVQQSQKSGTYSLQWDGSREDGVIVPSGVYLLKITTGNYCRTQKMVYVR